MDIRNPTLFRDPPSVVLLDLDDTLYEYAPAHEAGLAAAAALAKEALNVSTRDFHSNLDDAKVEIKMRLGKVASAHNRLIYFQRTIERMGFSTQPVLSLQMEQAYWSAFLDAATLFDEAIEFLDDLRIAGIPTIIVTDLSTHIQFRKIIYFGLDRYVHWVVTSEEVGLDKPFAANFELALAKLGGVEGPVWMVGESAAKDIGGARAAISAVGIQKRHAGVKIEGEGPDAPDALFDHFREVRRLLRDSVA